jgi:hypothetical protein
MDMNEAIDILGTQCQKLYTKNMVKALSMCTWLNNDKDKQRWEAGTFILRRWKKYSDACTEIRNNRSTGIKRGIYGN